MSFAHPALLWGLPAAALPALIHLLSRRAARRVQFSDLTLLAAVEGRLRPRSRLREALLLAARTLLILALVLAAAGPFARGASALAAGEGLDLVLLLDASRSLRARDGGRARFEIAREAGLRLLKRLSPGDRVAAGVFDETLRAPLAWADAAQAGQALSRACAGLRGTDAAAALAAARELLSRSPRGRRRAVVVLGDGAAHMLTRPAPAPAEGSAVLGLAFKPLANAWIAGVSPARGSSARSPRVEARVAAAGGPAARAVDLWIGDRRAASVPVAAAAGGEARASLALPPPADALAPEWNGRAAARPDALPDDDEFFFVARHRPEPRLLVLFSDPLFDRAGRAGWYLRRLFGGGERPISSREADFLAASRWAEADLARYGTVLLADASRLPTGLSSALERFASRGGGVWVIPGAGAGPDGLAELSAWLPARLGRAEESASPRGIRVLRAGPETEGWDEFALSNVAVGRRFRLEPGPGAAAWLAGSDGAPLLAAGPVGRGRAAVWAAPLDADWTNLGLKPLFVPWAEACLSLTLPPASEAAKPSRVGDPLVRVWRPDEPAPDRVAVVSPDGRRSTLSVRARRAELAAADKPGLYDFIEPDGRRTTFAVNLDSSRGESDLSPAASPPWSAVSPDALEDAFFAEVYGRDRRGWCLGLAVLALIAEMSLALPARFGRTAVVVLAGALSGAGAASAQQGDRFVWTQLRLGSSWDPYPEAPARVAAFLAHVTSARVAPDRRVIALGDAALFSSPFLYLAGAEAPPPLADADLRRIRQYLAGGGFAWIEDSTGGPPGSFDRWARRAIAQALPGSELKPLPPDHPIYRSFFLLRGPAGRVQAHGALEGAFLDGRVAALYTRDDVLGAWAQDALGRPLKPCVPGGETQRTLAQRLSLNILMYSMTGSYKSDAVHQAAILEKLRVAPR